MGWRHVQPFTLRNVSFCVLSPPCGMATVSKEPKLCFSLLVVPSPLGGMETLSSCPIFRLAIMFQAHRVGWRILKYHCKAWIFGGRVPSLPCGMETFSLILLFGLVNYGSKPTVWDGDLASRTRRPHPHLVLSPLRGMAIPHRFGERTQGQLF